MNYSGRLSLAGSSREAVDPALRTLIRPAPPSSVLIQKKVVVHRESKAGLDDDAESDRAKDQQRAARPQPRP
jgi:hypothetical protein